MKEKLKIKKISEKDLKIFYNTFSKIKEFNVNEKLNFYVYSEMKFWTRNPKDNILYGVYDKGKIIGFCYAKIMSNLWALIDNFYILPEYRNKKIGRELQKYIENVLKLKGINYISRVTRSDNYKMHSFLTKSKYKKQHEYTWFDKFL